MLLSELTPTSAAAAGRKAANLAALVRAGARVPPAWVILPGAEIPDRLPVPAPWVVRSSASIEDSAGGAAPGVFASVRDVEPAQLAHAVGRVRESARTVGALAYFEARGVAPAAVAMAVIVQQQVRPEIARGALYTRAPGASDRLLIEAHDGELVRAALCRRDSAAEIERDPGFPIAASALADLARGALSAERSLAAADGLDIEWVLSSDGIWLVQARPIPRRTSRASRPSADALAFSRDEPDVIWRWDVSHNPDPLTPAQIALVDRVAASAPYRMRVVEGYLYTADDPRQPTPGQTDTASDLVDRWRRTAGAIDAVLAPIEAQEAPDLGDALRAFERAFALYAPLSTALSRARGSLRDAGAPKAAMPVDPRHAGSISLAWDVGAPTLREAGAEAAHPVSAADLDDAGDLASVVAAIGEADDALFYRAQAIVRRALLGLARAWRLSNPDDIFYFPLAEAARAQRARRMALAMPLAIAAGRMLDAADSTVGVGTWRGRGGGGSARGAVARIGDMGELIGEPGVVVARTITPGQVSQLRGATAIVAEFGGMLGHAAAMARELGVPYAVGCVGAWSALAPGDEVVVDGDAGLVVRLSRYRRRR